jgi:hypothetical protein
MSAKGQSRHLQCTSACLLWANSGHLLISVVDVVASFHSHECCGEQSDELFVSPGFGEHLCLGQSEGAASFHHAPTRKDALACGRSEKIEL